MKYLIIFGMLLNCALIGDEPVKRKLSLVLF